MKFYLTIFLLLFTFTTTFASPAPDSTIYFKGTVYEALNSAQSSGKMLIVEFYAPWSYKSGWAHKNVVGNGRVRDFLKKSYILAMVDTQSESGANLALQYQVRDYPAFVIFNQNGNVVDKIETSLDADCFIQRLGQVILENDGSSALEIKRIYNQAEAGNYAEADRLAMKYFNRVGMQKAISPLFWELFSNIGVCFWGSSTFSYVIDNREKFNEVFGVNEVNRLIAKILNIEAMKYAIGTGVYTDREVETMKKLAAGVDGNVEIFVDLRGYINDNKVDEYLIVLGEVLKKVESEQTSSLIMTLDFVAERGTKEQKRTAHTLLNRYGRSSKSLSQLKLIDILSKRLSE